MRRSRHQQVIPHKLHQLHRSLGLRAIGTRFGSSRYPIVTTRRARKDSSSAATASTTVSAPSRHCIQADRASETYLGAWPAWSKRSMTEQLVRRLAGPRLSASSSRAADRRGAWPGDPRPLPVASLWDRRVHPARLAGAPGQWRWWRDLADRLRGLDEREQRSRLPPRAHAFVEGEYVSIRDAGNEVHHTFQVVRIGEASRACLRAMPGPPVPPAGRGSSGPSSVMEASTASCRARPQPTPRWPTWREQ
jgi:hypothetical protein